MGKTICTFFNNLRSHIVEVCSNRDNFEPYLICTDEAERKKLFSRVRSWTLLRVVNAVLLCFKETLSTEIIEFFLSKDKPSTTSEAYIKRRGFVSSLLFRDLNDWIINEMADSQMAKTWKRGKYLCGIDGTRLSLPYTPELYKLYRERDDKGHNLARGAFITDLVNRVIIRADIYPNKTEERKASLELLTSGEFPYPLQSTVFVMDRGYPSLQLMNWFNDNTAGFIIRARRDTNPQIAKFMDSNLKSTSVVLILSKNRRDIDYPCPKPLKVRLVKRPPIHNDDDQNDNEPVVFITNLDKSEFDDKTIASAYRMRWRSETEIGTEKNELQIEIFSGIRDICIRQDFYAAIILYNIESIIRIPSNLKLKKHKGKEPIQVDLNQTWQFTISLVNNLFGPQSELDAILTFTVNLYLRLYSVERPGRASPRNKRKIKVSGKYITFTNYKRAI